MVNSPNSIYLIAGYTVFLGGISLYFLSLVLRQRNLKRDEEMLAQMSEQLQEEANRNDSAADRTTAPVQPGK
jgi:hypothetical protein